MQPASSVEPLLRTALLYADRAELRASFVLRDADGRSLVSSVGLVVQMVATGPSGANCDRAPNKSPTFRAKINLSDSCTNSTTYNRI